jgi:hypothetical protein
MSKHEKRCTLNPDRVCGVCAFCSGDDQAKMSDLLAILPKADPARIKWPDMKCGMDGECTQESIEKEDAVKAYRAELREQVLAVWKALEEAANDCPACILAAIRQAGVAPVVDWWKFKDALKSAMDDANQARMERNCYEL